MFGAVDLFAPFSPLEADREWRRGVDAIRTDIKLTDRSSLDILGAFGTTWDRSAVAARLRGFAGPIDVEMMGGRRAQDWFGGMTTSAAVGDAELHGEVAGFRVPPMCSKMSRESCGRQSSAVRTDCRSDRASWRTEYHYSGFGAARPGDILRMLSSPDFRERYIRGDTQILSRHALALSSYEASPEFTYAGQWIAQPERSLRHRRAQRDVYAERPRIAPRDRVYSIAVRGRAHRPFGANSAPRCSLSCCNCGFTFKRSWTNAEGWFTW